MEIGGRLWCSTLCMLLGGSAVRGFDVALTERIKNLAPITVTVSDHVVRFDEQLRTTWNARRLIFTVKFLGPTYAQRHFNRV
jgi:hypothetical protein